MPPCAAHFASGSSRLERSARPLPIGTLRPSIVLYDEPHPLGEDIGNLQAYDLSRSPDLLLIMGTSLKVHGLKKVVKAFAKAVHARKGTVVFVNATPPSKEWEGVIDVHVQGETDVWVERVEEEWRRLRPQDWETQTKLDGEVVVKVSASAKGKGKAAAKGAAWSSENREGDLRLTIKFRRFEVYSHRACSASNTSTFPIADQIVIQAITARRASSNTPLTVQTACQHATVAHFRIWFTEQEAIRRCQSPFHWNSGHAWSWQPLR